MAQTGRVGIGTFVMRGHQYLVAVISDGKLLRAETLRFAAELRSPKDVGLPKRAKPVGKDVKRLAGAIESLTRDKLDLEELSDRYAAALERLAEKKAKKGKDLVDAAAESEDAEEGGAEIIDLMKILKQRVGAGARAPARKSSARRRSSASKRPPRRAA
jgi:DNA end-binding protein Ku